MPLSSPRLLDSSREASLRERLVARDERALAELIDLATPWLLNIARAMLRDEDEAQEVVLEAFRTVWRNLPQAGGEHGRLMPYLMRVTRHRAIDRLRRRRRLQRKHLMAAPPPESLAAAPSEPDEAGDPGFSVHTQVHAALDALPPDQRTAVDLAYFKGLTQSEIAAELGIPLGTVKTRLRLAFGRLRTALAGLKGWVG